jgi:hypothetical protein
MGMRRNVKIGPFILVILAATLVDRPSHAYDGGTHHSIVSLGWEVMRAGADPQFGNHIDWKPIPPNPVGIPPAPLGQVGACEFCGPGATQQAWTNFIATIEPAMVRLNTLDPGLSFIPCTGRLTSDNTIKGMVVAFGQDPSQIESPKECADLGRHLQGGAYNGKWHPGGIFDFTTPNPAIDGNGYQGLLLGWESKTGDDHIDDTVLESIWLIFGTTVAIIIGALVIAGILVAGGAVFLAGAAAVVFVLALLFCIAGIFDGDGCTDGVINGFTHVIEAAHAPATALDNLVPELDGILPRGGDISSSGYTGMWHFIRARSGGSNSYDDREGLDYDEAGPEFPGQSTC